MKFRFTGPVLLSLAALALFFFPHVTSRLEFNRSALAHGEYWRLLTGHLVHFNPSHLAWDVLTMLVLSTLLPALDRRGWWGLLAGAAVVISAGVFFFAPQFETYRGLSGIDCALFGAAVAHLMRRARREGDTPMFVVTLLAGIGFVGKCGWELQQGVAVFAHSSGDFLPVPLAHLLGAGWGVGWLIGSSARSVARSKDAPGVASSFRFSEPVKR